jgi:cell division septation protein DedD
MYSQPVDLSGKKLYRLQVGAYSTQDGANRAVQLVRAAGFNAVLEQSGSFSRVLAANIAGPNVYAAANRLGAMGFRQIWVREQ